MERSYADAANNHGFKRSRWRGIEKITIQDLMIEAAQNIRILIKHARKPAGVARGGSGNADGGAQSRSCGGYIVSIALFCDDILARRDQIIELPPFRNRLHIETIIQSRRNICSGNTP